MAARKNSMEENVPPATTSRVRPTPTTAKAGVLRRLPNTAVTAKSSLPSKRPLTALSSRTQAKSTKLPATKATSGTASVGNKNTESVKAAEKLKADEGPSQENAGITVEAKKGYVWCFL